MGKMQVKDGRAKFVQSYILKGEIARWDEIFHVAGFPFSVLATYLGTNNNRLRRLIRDPGLMTLQDIKRIADYFEVPYDAMSALVSAQYKADKCR